MRINSRCGVLGSFQDIGTISKKLNTGLTHRFHGYWAHFGRRSAHLCPHTPLDSSFRSSAPSLHFLERPPVADPLCSLVPATCISYVPTRIERAERCLARSRKIRARAGRDCPPFKTAGSGHNMPIQIRDQRRSARKVPEYGEVVIASRGATRRPSYLGPFFFANSLLSMPA